MATKAAATTTARTHDALFGGLMLTALAAAVAMAAYGLFAPGAACGAEAKSAFAFVLTHWNCGG